MKAKEVLRRYAAGERDFRRENLRGQSFQGEDLSGADFSEADIRGANFKNANLTETKFCKAKAGLQKRWAIVVLLVSWIASGLSGIIYLFSGEFVEHIFNSTNITEKVLGWTILVVIIVLFAIILRQGIGGPVAVVLVVAGTGSLAVALGKVFAEAVAGALAGALAIIGFVAGVLALAVAVVGFVAGALAVVGAGVIAGAEAVAGALAGAEAEAVAVAVAGAGALLGTYLGWRALKGNPRDAWIRSIAIAFAATGGTSFYKANLTNADFTGATLKSTDLREATITCTCWRKTIKLDQARPGKTILADTAVRELLVHGKSYNKSYVNANLRGANLKEANLNKANLKQADLSKATLENAELEEADLVNTNLRGANLKGANLNKANLKQADLSEATLEDANLKGANLTQANCVGTNFTDAYLTGACLEAWNIDSKTRLTNVDCQYVFLLENPDNMGSRERRPHDFNRVFEPGDFDKLYKQIMNTVQILLRNGVNPEAFRQAFQELMAENPEITGDSIQAIERKGNDVLLTLEILGSIDKGKVEIIFLEVYEARLEDAKRIGFLEGKDEANTCHLQNIKDVINAFTSQQSSNSIINLTNTAKSESDMSDNSRHFNIDQNRATNPKVNTNPNFAVANDNARQFNTTNFTPEQKQNLAEAAAEIQQLLNQISQTNPTTTSKEKMIVVSEVVDQIENNPPLKAKVINALKAGGVEAFKEAINHPLVNVLMAMIEELT
ncbi:MULTISPECIES: pentapeptide repeat-containing protein [unclassified Moorena]|uniref:pentapeptide repeat-containing protein n=1 Tax=unclassified Moorena TaxID=2683338 RepID=UPI0013CA1219|nr:MULTISPECIES: pentapeptide repeat-containing protein [unclassified Moorena]NEO22131.1 pentapeptide repeat-containing protein [Moorena sp. SIO4A5]NEP24324.1 pentapeptide repeat-containing protein [Moorena sp. SIO3I6]